MRPFLSRAESSSQSVAAPPPDGMNYIAAIHPSLNNLIIGTIWSSMLIPILVALLLFSTPALRRKPIFILNVLAILIGITEGIVSAVIQIGMITAPSKPMDASLIAAFSGLCLLVPLSVETILLFRVVAVYPPRLLSWKHLVLVYGPPIAFKIVRLVNGMIFIVRWSKDIREVRNYGFQAGDGESLWSSQPWTKIEWSLQLADNSYTSILFLLRLNPAAWQKSDGSSSRHGRTSYASKLRALFWIAVFNFVFPVLLSLAQLILAFVDSNYLHVGYVYLTNNYVEIIGVLLASVWASGVDWVGEDPGRETATITAPRFKTGGRVDTEMSTSTWEDRESQRDAEREREKTKDLLQTRHQSVNL